MDYILLLSIGMAVIGIVITAAFIAINGMPGSDKLKNRIIKNGVKTEATIKQITTTSEGLLTPVVRFVVKWGFEDKAILFYCNKNGFAPEDYPEMLKEGNSVNIVYHPNDFDSLYVDMGDGTYFGQSQPQWNILGLGIGMIIMAPVLYFGVGIM
ncbi:MAG: DUF3592 domain-containing protein [Huintestinicola sp.]